jgi:GNAT superfamily N-acetyltransferase
MSTWNVRPIQIPEDFTRLAEILTAINPEPKTVENLVDENNRPHGFQHRAVVTDAAGCMVGYGYVRHYPFEQEGRYFLRVIVDPAQRGQGAGGALYRHLEDWTATHNPAAFETMARDNDPASVAFAERRGYVTFQHAFDSILNPRPFDETPYAGVVEAAT